MKPAHSLTFIAYLLGSTVPATAQEMPPAPKLVLFVAAEGGVGSGDGSPGRRTAYGGVKIGSENVALDLGYDRVQSHGGLSLELSGFFPLVSVPKLQRDREQKYLSIYVGPGFGFRAGPKTSATYLGIRMTAVFFSDARVVGRSDFPSPFVEIERRLMLSSLPNDTRVVFGLMLGSDRWD